MSLINTLFHIHLQRLFGPQATITNVNHVEEMVEFNLPVDQPQSFDPGVAMTVYGIVDGKIACSISTNTLERQLYFHDVLNSAVKTDTGKTDPTPS